jgi:hypothetical protein
MNKSDALKAVQQLPYLCKAKDPERWADIAAYVFEKEFSGSSVFAQKEGEASMDRIAVIFGFTAFEHDVRTAAYCRSLFAYACDVHCVQSHGEKIPNLDRQKARLLEKEKKFPEVAEVLSVEAASTDSGWNA